MYQLFFLFQRLCSFSTNENRWSPGKETIWIFLFDVKLTSASLVVTQIWTLFQRILFLAENKFGCSPYLILIKQWTGINSWKILLKYQAYTRATWLQHYSTKFTALWTFILSFYGNFKAVSIHVTQISTAFIFLFCVFCQHSCITILLMHK